MRPADRAQVLQSSAVALTEIRKSCRLASVLWGWQPGRSPAPAVWAYRSAGMDAVVAASSAWRPNGLIATSTINMAAADQILTKTVLAFMR